MLIRCANIAQLLCAFVFVYAKNRFSHDVALISDCQLLLSVYTSVFEPCYEKPGPEVIKKNSCSTQLSMKFKLLINSKIVGIKGMFMPRSLKIVIYPANKC